MEQVALNNVQLDYLAQDNPQLKLYFYGTVACDRFPKTPDKKTPRAYTRTHMINPVNIGRRTGPIRTCVKRWIAAPYPWRDTNKLPHRETGSFGIKSMWWQVPSSRQ